jgi:tetratricopeptide (TPR) repeat protein
MTTLALRQTVARFVIAIFTIAILAGCGKVSEDPTAFPTLRGPYLGQKPPGLIPELFAPFIAPPEDHKHSSPAFSPDGTEMYFSVYENYEFPQKIKVMRQVDGVWTAPELVSFSGQYQEGGPKFSPDGNRLYYYSKRPRGEDTVETELGDVWFVERTPTGWSDPVNLGAPINTPDGYEIPVAFSPDGKLIYMSGATNQLRKHFACALNPETGLALTESGPGPQPYDGPELASGVVSQGACYLADRDVLVIHNYNLETRVGGLYLSQRAADGSWSDLKSMGDMINRRGARFPRLSPDGKYLFFLSYREGPEEIFWVDASIIDTLRYVDLNLTGKLISTIDSLGFDHAIAMHTAFRERYTHLYDFNDLLFDDIGDRLLVAGDLTNAARAYRLNRDLYPEQFGGVRALKLAITDNDSTLKQQAVSTLTEEAQQPDNVIERSLNQLGYEFLAGSLVDRAIELFELNTRLFPTSGNVFDSYAEALLVSGDTAASITNYQKSVRLDPNNQNAASVLEQLGVD